MKKIAIYLTIITVLLGIQGAPVFGADAPEITAKGAVLINADTGDILYEKNKDEELAPASTTKMMTALLTVENVSDLDKVITIGAGPASTGGQSLYLQEGEKISVRELLHGMLIYSGNDSAVALAEEVAGSVPEFAKMMNTRAKKLGAKNTHFVNANGLDADGHYSTAYDLSLIAQEVMKHKEIKDIVKLAKYTIPATNLYADRKLTSTNKLLYDKATPISVNGKATVPYYKYAIGIKTGFTDLAKCCLVAEAKKNGTSLLAVTLNGDEDLSRFEDCIEMFEYGFENYETYIAVKKGEDAGSLNIKRGAVMSVEAELAENVALNIKKGADTGGITTEAVSDEVQAPVKKGQKVGILKVYDDGKKVSETSLIAKESIKKGWILSAIGISNRMTIVLLITVVLLVFAVRALRKKRR